MVKCVNCGNTIEEDSEFCYFCGFNPKEEIGEEINLDEEVLRSAQQTQQELLRYEQSDYDYELHGANPLYEVKGNRGRRLYVYQHKCVIKVDITLGSIVTQNATDGEKTIYYKDVIGVQFKEPGITIGYLQLETASAKGNNKNSNFFDENTFTFDNYSDVYDAYKYIILRLDEIKNI